MYGSFFYFGNVKEVMESHSLIKARLAVCKICKQELSYRTNTTSRMNHVRSYHPEKLEKTNKYLQPNIVQAFGSTPQSLPYNGTRATAIIKGIAE